MLLVVPPATLPPMELLFPLPPVGPMLVEPLPPVELVPASIELLWLESLEPQAMNRNGANAAILG
jgi:hypothetical protein